MNYLAAIAIVVSSFYAVPQAAQAYANYQDAQAATVARAAVTDAQHARMVDACATGRTSVIMYAGKHCAN